MERSCSFEIRYSMPRKIKLRKFNIDSMGKKLLIVLSYPAIDFWLEIKCISSQEHAKSTENIAYILISKPQPLIVC